MTEPNFDGPMGADDEEFDNEFRIDFTNVKARNFDPVPTGKYLCAVTDYERRMTGESAKNPNQPMFNFEFTIQQPEKVKEMDTAERKVWNNFMPTIESTHGILKSFLGALGFDVSGALTFKPDAIMQLDLEERLLVLKLGIQPQRKVGDKTYEASNKITGYYHRNTWTGTGVSGGNVAAAGGGGSLLP
jgi:hypothetical protein